MLLKLCLVIILGTLLGLSTNSFSNTATMVGSDTVSVGSFAAERVECPSGMIAVGGGVDLNNVLTMKVTSSGPTFDQNSNRLIFQPDGINPAPIGWQASARNDDTTDKSFKVAAICRPQSNITTVVGSDTVIVGSFAAERVECPSGMIAVGGGVDLNNVLTMKVTSSGPTFDQNSTRLIFQPDGINPAPIGWQASARNDGTTDQSFKVAAICSPQSNITTVVGSNIVTVGSFAAERVECPSGMIAVGGGVDLNNVLTMKVTSSGPTFDQNSTRLIFQPDGINPAPIGWQASARNDGATDQSLKVAAICMRPIFPWTLFLPAILGN